MSLLQYFQLAEAVQQTYCVGGRRRVDDNECGGREARERERERERERLHGNLQVAYSSLVSVG